MRRAGCDGRSVGVTVDGRRRIGGFERLKCMMKPDLSVIAALARKYFTVQRTRLCAFRR